MENELEARVQRKLNALQTTVSSVETIIVGVGVTNGNAHDHVGGDGAQIDYTSLSNRPTIYPVGQVIFTDGPNPNDLGIPGTWVLADE